ncbi:condensation domain-containing protein, partial [Streptomyces sp. ICBB 8177]|uniref:condensation domain-containing protein n=1 Tax=Streptomyces sp. ICBB 8177 TaxID=563922 RepID=UPI000D673277
TWHTEVHNLYGPTETTIDATAHHITPQDTGPAIPIGHPIWNTHALILDHHLQPVPPGTTGELYLTGPGLAHHYLNQPTLTATRFIPNPYGPPGTRLYRTGDQARWTHGHLHHTNRTDDQIKLRGHRIEPTEITTTLTTHPHITTTHTQLREDQPGVRRLVAYVVTRDGRPADAAGLRAHLAERLPEYMIPSAFVTLDALPLLPNGKVDRRALPAPDPVAERTGARPPRTDAERALCAAFAETLGVAEVGVDDDFFALGGDSIMSIQVVSRARKAGLVITARDVFTRRTPEAIASAAVPLGAEPRAEADSGVGQVPLTPIAAWFLERPGPRDGYNQSSVLRAPAGADEASIAAALQALVDHHDTLRLRVTGSPGAGHGLEVLPQGAVPARDRLTRVDVAGLDREEVDAVVSREAETARRRLRPSQGVVLEAVWFDAGASRPGRLLLVVHHLAVDAVSWRILVADLATAWEHVTAGGTGPAPLPAVLTSYRRWAELLTAEARGDERAAELPLWLEVLGTADPLLGYRALDPHQDTADRTRTLRVTLPARWTRPLLTTAPAAYRAGVDDVLITALALAVVGRRAEKSGDGGSAVLLDLEGHGREQQIADGVDLSRTVGWFTSVYPVSVDPGPVSRYEARALDGAVVDRAVKRVKEQLRRIPDRGIGFGLLRHLNPRTASALRGTAPQIGFNYLGRYANSPGASGDWQPMPDAAGPRAQDPQAPAAHVVDINAHTRDLPDGPCLVAELTWPVDLLKEEDVEELAEGWLRALRAVAEYAQEPDAGGHTPSDLPLVSLNQNQIDRLRNKWGGRK